MRTLTYIIFLLSASMLVGQTSVSSPAAGSESTKVKTASLEDRIEESDWILDLGMFYANVDSSIQLNGTGGLLGTDVDFESDLGLAEDELLFNATLAYRGWKRWSVGVEWFELDRNAGGSTERDIAWDDTLIPVGAAVNTFFDVNIVRLFGGYEFWRSEKSVIGGMAGLHGAKMSAGIDAQFTVGGNSTNYTGEASTGSIIPLPNFGLWAGHAFNDRLIGTAQITAFAIEIDDYKGSLINAGVNLRYKATDRLSLGAGYAFFDLDVEMKRNRWNGEAEFAYHGPKLFVFYAW